MQAGRLRYFRIIEVTVCGMFALFGVAAAVSPHGSLGAAIGLWAFAAVAALMFELRFRAHRKTVRRVRQGLEQVGRTDLDAPAPVTERGSDDFVEEIAANRALASMIARRSTRFCVTGTWQGRELEIGTAIVAGRDFDQMISYVCALDKAVRGPFRVMTKGAVTSFARLGMTTSPVATGDAAFDAKWVVDADALLCRTVLDAAMRAKLLDLQSRLAWLQVGSIESTRFGLVVRWPGELSPAGAAYLRDLALEVRGRLAAGA